MDQTIDSPQQFSAEVIIYCPPRSIIASRVATQDFILKPYDTETAHLTHRFTLVGNEDLFHPINQGKAHT